MSFYIPKNKRRCYTSGIKCTLRKIVKLNKITIWYSNATTDGHSHRHEETITEDQYNKYRADWESFEATVVTCDKCGQEFVPSGAALGEKNVWDTEDGKLHIGDMYYDHREHLCVVLPPDEHHWDIDSRASNCTMPEDNEHHCWVRHGEPPCITVDKNGNTCQAGAGSILTPKWHGFLINGELVEC